MGKSKSKQKSKDTKESTETTTTKTETTKTVSEPKSDADKILDDWLNGGDDELVGDTSNLTISKDVTEDKGDPPKVTNDVSDKKIPADAEQSKSTDIPDKAVSGEVKEEVKPPSGYKALPMEDATDAWMLDDDVQMSLDDDDEEEVSKIVKSAEKVTDEKTSSKEEVKPASGYKSLPMNDASDAWMDDDDGGFVMIDEDDAEVDTVKKDEEKDALKTDETSTEKKAEMKEEPKPATGYKALPMNDASDAWMDDEDAGFTMDDDDEEENTMKEDEDRNKIETSSDNKTELKEEPKPATGYKALPMNDASDAWMDAEDAGFTMDDDEEEVEKTQDNDKCVDFKPEEQTSKDKSKDTKSTKEDSKQSKEVKAPVEDPKSDVDQILDDWLNGSEEEEEVKKSKDKDRSKDKSKSTKAKSEELKSNSSKPKSQETKAVEEPKSDIDQLLDDWLNGAEEEVPDELPDIDDIKESKPKVKDIKTQKKNNILGDMSKLSNIMDETTDKSVQNSVENWFTGGKVKKEKLVEKKMEPKATPLKPEVARVPEGDCAVCGRAAKAICTGCKNIFYCSRDCQRKHWATHKEECKGLAKLPYRIERNDVLGRFLIATKPIEEGQLIFDESPMVIGPKQLTKPVCLGCYKEITGTTPFVKCVRCNWPVCSQKCADTPCHDPECRATRAAGSRIKVEHFDQINMMYACITVLRALALQDGPKKIWEDYTKFDSHLQERIKTPIYNKVNKEKVVFFILHYLNIKRYSDLEILEACGKLDTNSFEIKQNGLNLRAMYRLGSIMSHDCCPNTRHTFGPDNSIYVYSTRKINVGDVISATYTKGLYSTMERLEHLKTSKCFWCSCSRCADPTENGSYLSAIKCSQCSSGYLLPKDPLDVDSNWACDNPDCDNEQRASGIKSGNAQIAEEMKSLDRHSLTSLVKFLAKYEPLLGSSNHHIVETKFTIMMMLGNNDNYALENLTRDLLEMKENFALQLLEVANKMDPGCSKIRGQILLELQMAQVSLAAGLEQAGEISKFQAKEKAEVAFKNLQEAVKILQVEPDMKSVLEDRMNIVSSVLAKFE